MRNTASSAPSRARTHPLDFQVMLRPLYVNESLLNAMRPKDPELLLGEETSEQGPKDEHSPTTDNGRPDSSRADESPHAPGPNPPGDNSTLLDSPELRQHLAGVGDTSKVSSEPAGLDSQSIEAHMLLGPAVLRALVAARSLTEDAGRSGSGKQPEPFSETSVLLAGLGGPSAAWLSHELVAAGVHADHILLCQ